jgi:MoaA/NifB/PqqE/SkfB family radical SAM enzyme
MTKKYPLEIEFTNHCTLRCKTCISKDLKEKWFLKEEVYDLILDFIIKNIDKIEFLAVAGLWDSFLHPKILLFLDKLKILKNTNLPILFPTKWITMTKDIALKIKELRDVWVSIDIQIWIFSIDKKVQNFLCWIGENFDYFPKFVEIVKLFKKNWINFSIELVLTKISEREVNAFWRFCEELQINWEVHQVHNFWGKLKNYEVLKTDKKMIFFDETKKDCYPWIGCYTDKCGFYPYIDFKGNMYPWTFCCHYKPIKMNKIKNKNYNLVVESFINIIDLENSFCKRCTYNPNNMKTYENTY